MISEEKLNFVSWGNLGFKKKKELLLTWECTWVTRNWTLGSSSGSFQSGSFHSHWAWSWWWIWSRIILGSELHWNQKFKIGKELHWLIQPTYSYSYKQKKKEESVWRISDLLWVKLPASGRDHSRILIFCLLVSTSLYNHHALGYHRTLTTRALQWEDCQATVQGVQNYSGYFLEWGKGIFGVRKV